MKRHLAAYSIPVTLLLAVSMWLMQIQGCGGGSGGGATGTLKVAITDSPAFQSYSSVHLRIVKVMAVPSGKEGVADTDRGLITVADFGAQGQDVDILKLHFLQQVLGTVQLPAGSYNQVRLILAPNPAGAPFNNYFILNGSTSQVALTTPSAQQTGVKINGHFTVAPGVLTTILLDFNPNDAIVMRGHTGQDNLKPTGIRIMQVFASLETSASISGQIRTALFASFSSASVAIVPRNPGASAISSGIVYSTYSGAGVWKAPFVAYVPPNGSAAMPSTYYKVFVQGYRDSAVQSAGFRLYSSALMNLPTGGIDYPAQPGSGMVLLQP